MAVLAGEYFRGELDEKLCAVTGIRWTKEVVWRAAEGHRVAGKGSAEECAASSMNDSDYCQTTTCKGPPTAFMVVMTHSRGRENQSGCQG